MSSTNRLKQPMSTLRIVLAGSTHHTRLIAEALLAAQFQILGCITPQPKLVGRKQVLTYNPVHEWANEQQIPTILIGKSRSFKVSPA